MPKLHLDPATTLPSDDTAGTLVGRAWLPAVDGPAVVVVRADSVYDISRAFPTVRDLAEARAPAAAVATVKGERIGTLAEVLANTPEEGRDPTKPWLLAPVDLQAIKAAGVTFAQSLLERVIEEQARGAPEKAAAVTKWTKSYWEAVHPFNLGGAYPNFMMDDEGEARVRAAYGGNYERLSVLKKKYDPENLFRVNQNIHPAA